MFAAVHDGGGFPEGGGPTRESFERLAAAWLRGHDDFYVAVRADTVGLLVVGESRGFLRLHRNCLGCL